MYDGSSGSSSLNPIFIMAATGLSKLCSLQGFFPLAISSMEHPKDHISDFTPYSYCLIISGAIHGILPLISSLKFLLILVRVLFILFAHPKSLNFTMLLWLTKILLPFMSLWIILFWCKKFSPFKIWIENPLIYFSLIFPIFSMIYCILPYYMYSK